MNENRIFNFSAGPGTLPTEVLYKAQTELLSFQDLGMSIMEMSHRSAPFDEVLQSAKRGIRTLLNVPENYRILFLQGGASLQFSMIPANFLAEKNASADYVVTGHWGEKAFAEAARIGSAQIIHNERDNGFRRVPLPDEIKISENAAYLHYTSNETIEGVEFKYDLDGGRVPVVCDASSNILSKPIDIEKYALIYAGAQKNLAPSGTVLVIIREDLLEKVPSNQMPLFDYRKLAENDSMLNTPNTFGIYMIELVCRWLLENGGLSEMARRNEEKARILYEAIDAADGFYQGHAERESRSLMNVTFRLPSEEAAKKFVSEADKNGLSGLAGHRSVGGVRASIYNAMPREGVERLVEFMREFAANH